MRKSVERFVNAMEEKLKENDQKGKKGWKHCNDWFLHKKLLEEVAEYFISLDHPRWSNLTLIQEFVNAVSSASNHSDIKFGKKYQKRELADIGNIAMMLHDNI